MDLLSNLHVLVWPDAIAVFYKQFLFQHWTTLPGSLKAAACHLEAIETRSDLLGRRVDTRQYSVLNRVTSKAKLKDIPSV